MVALGVQAGTRFIPGVGIPDNIVRVHHLALYFDSRHPLLTKFPPEFVAFNVFSPYV